MLAVCLPHPLTVRNSAARRAAGEICGEPADDHAVASLCSVRTGPTLTAGHDCSAVCVRERETDKLEDNTLI